MSNCFSVVFFHIIKLLHVCGPSIYQMVTRNIVYFWFIYYWLSCTKRSHAGIAFTQWLKMGFSPHRGDTLPR